MLHADTMAEPRKVAVIGLGYVGCVSAACMAKIGHQVCGADCDPSKIEKILAGQCPFFEPELEEIIRAAVAAGHFTVTQSTTEALRDAEIALIAVGTPSQRDGDISLHQLHRVLGDIKASLQERTQPLIVVIRSTVPPGTCEEIVAPAFRSYPQVSVVCNPEFLREGSAVSDFLTPSLVVVGGTNLSAVRAVANLYAPLAVKASLVDSRTAEMIKFACNAFHAVKITFANEVGTLCSSLGIDGMEVMETLCQDVRLNLSSAYLRPGFAFGGSCLSKDVRALNAYAARLDLKLPLLESTLPSNSEHLERAVSRVLEAPAKRLGIIGLAFKENTDDLRESPVVTLIRRLLEYGRGVRIYDPHIQLVHIYGSNRQFIVDAVPSIDGLIVHRMEDILHWADAVVITQRLCPDTLQKLSGCNCPVIDLTQTADAGGISGGPIRREL